MDCGGVGLLDAADVRVSKFAGLPLSEVLPVSEQTRDAIEKQCVLFTDFGSVLIDSVCAQGISRLTSNRTRIRNWQGARHLYQVYVFSSVLLLEGESDRFLAINMWDSADILVSHPI